MVLRVCVRALGDTPDAEDAFQATFIVLAWRAPAVTRPGLLANWLYGVAHRTALKARARAARQRAAERQVSPVTALDPLDELAQRGLVRALDDELSRLPEKYRAPIVLCYFEGLTHEEIGRRLGCPRKTVTTRLARGCQRLRTALTRRGITLSALALAALLSDRATAMPARLLETTVHAAVTGPVPVGVAGLAKEVLAIMCANKLKRFVLLLLVGAAAVLLGGFAPTGRYAAAQPKPGVQPPAPPAASGTRKEPVDEDIKKILEAADARIVAQRELNALQGRWMGQSAEQDGKALPEDEAKRIWVSIKDDRLLLIPGGEWAPVTIRLDPKKSPKVLSMAPADRVTDKSVPAIYQLDKGADTLTLCWDAKDGKAVPTEFATKKGSGLMLIVLKHEPRKPADQNAPPGD
jgi:RNA polymerase sigma-70 factor (ECF subfamily)